ncbi:MAG TPA: hypothetical protein VFQ92_17150 [Blastocatellia bacterium]|nr:hypothetical protein [Blastocatellia bacterium]
MTLLLAIGTALIMTAIAVAIGGFLLEIILSALNQSLKEASEGTVPAPPGARVIGLRSADSNSGVMDWGGEKVAA